MIEPVLVKVSEAHLPDLSVVNSKYWTYAFERHELDGLGYVCPSCDHTRIIKSYVENREPTLSPYGTNFFPSHRIYSEWCLQEQGFASRGAVPSPQTRRNLTS